MDENEVIYGGWVVVTIYSPEHLKRPRIHVYGPYNRSKALNVQKEIRRENNSAIYVRQEMKLSDD